MKTYVTFLLITVSAFSSLVASAENPGQVHFEAVDAQGNFTAHRILADPLASSYIGILAFKKIAVSPPNRIGIVILGDGYTSSEMGKYADDAKNVIDQLSTQEPFKLYADYFNFYRLDVASQDSGVSNDPNGQVKNTAFEMQYFCSGIARLLCANAEKVMAAAAAAPKVDAVFAMANSSTYGGAGYWNPPISTLAAGNAASLEIALHEFGHTFGLLADEYDTSGGTSTGCEARADISLQDGVTMNAQKSKWYRWLDQPNVGAFLGACYMTTGFYRPTNNSKMRALGRPFEQVNIEQFVINIYKHVHPIDETAPAPGSYQGNQVLSVTPMQPSDHKMTVTWAVDGVPRFTLDQTMQIDTATLDLPAGTHTVMATVMDPTDAVRDEDARKAYMTQNAIWNIKIP